MQEGQPAIDFTLKGTAGQDVSLSDYKGKYIILYFYPKDHTPGCTTQACDFRDQYAAYEDLGAVILGVSRDTVATHQKFTEKHALPFLLLSDPDAKVCQMYEVFKEKNMFGQKKMGIERSTFIIDPQFNIVKAYRKVKVKDHVALALAFVREHIEKGQA
ncbi:thioredoxin-dependent thiol peroxidase [Hazenella sp. IB182357]|uniref:thioredoxin-dependent peroxiredoxin n=1 Tax=Polycladospora coralii TaxID=2771432 RepID=A0A926NIC5_9BACL|nr:thioredoxin-dependent thiol peroxidase [Polycladospora coralii]MBD1373803.1 thioredoxin-dependent thiol peroxidase [Polycladospora coralii]MBS7531545.1 thioredoxin-dependent thiol peroxidase [Polycladospora coralii]